MPHVWHIFAPMLPEARRAIGHIGGFLRERLQPI
jgi:acetyl esterase/lipase